MGKNFFIVLLIILSIILSGFSVNPGNQIMDEKKLLHLKNSSAPVIYKNGILFTYKGEGQSVYLSGTFVNWEEMIKMEKSYFGVWYYFFKKSINPGIYGYRYNVDNFWILDPANKEITRDERDHPLSLLYIPEKLIFFEKSPIIEEDNTVLFWLKDIEARTIYIYGDFNNWDPYQFPLKKEGNLWNIKIKLSPGRYGYRFIIDFEKEILDPNNPIILENKFGEKCSIIEIK